ncbi:hypothetical protein T4D_7434 [Trichinella pseudospiralis]|uniref:Uncharacterized protein n=1 Tax=Trichinella pseudospiralis TaxID=6337 RepID=A0A0V1FJG1_TRIPS|nr:hypothetical protein T4D_7434 [Trichinella pseudospiralis]
MVVHRRVIIIRDYETQLSNNHQDDSFNPSAATAWQSLKFTSFIDLQTSNLCAFLTN